MRLEKLCAVAGLFVGLVPTLGRVLAAPQNTETRMFSDVRALCFSADGNRLLAATRIYTKPQLIDWISPLEADNRVRVYDVRSGRQQWVASTRPISQGPVLLFPDSKTLLTSWGAWEVKPVDIHTYRIGKIIKVSNGSITSLALSPAKKLLAIGATACIEIRDAKTYALLRTYNHGGQGTRVQFGPDSNTIFATWGTSRPQCISTQKARQVPWPRWAYRVRDADAWTFSPDGKRIALAKGQKIEIWSSPIKTSGDERLQTHATALLKVRDLAFSPDSKTLAVGGASGGKVPVQFIKVSGGR
jgi:WD40 repeat protein